MPFSDQQILEINETIERILWSKRRPPLVMRDQIREGQRIEGFSVVLFMNRPRWDNPEEWLEHPIAKTTFVKSRNVWKVYWMRADLKWHLYDPPRELPDFESFLRLVDRDEYGCFWG